MKKCALVLSLAVTALAIGVRPAAAQLGGITGALKKAQTVKKVADLKVTDAEERQIGQQVSDKMVETFGVYQDADVTKYVTLVGAVLAQAEPQARPRLAVRGARHRRRQRLRGARRVRPHHEGPARVDEERSRARGRPRPRDHSRDREAHRQRDPARGRDQPGVRLGWCGGRHDAIAHCRLRQRAYSNILNGKFSRDDENEADDKGVQLANKVGYAPNGLGERADEADRSQQGREGTERHVRRRIRR